MQINKFFGIFFMVMIMGLPPMQTLAASTAASGVEPAFEQKTDASSPSAASGTSDADERGPAAEGDTPEKAEEQRNINNQTYEDWLNRYRAWDKLDTVYAGQSESPDTILRRIANLLEAGQPDKAFQLVQQTGSFLDESVNAQPPSGDKLAETASATASAKDAAGQSSQQTASDATEKKADHGTGTEPDQDAQQPAQAADYRSTEQAADQSVDTTADKTAPAPDGAAVAPDRQVGIQQSDLEDEAPAAKPMDKAADAAKADKAVAAMEAAAAAKSPKNVVLTDKERADRKAKLRAQESLRLWYGGRALRAMGAPNQAVMWFSQSGKLLTPEELRTRFNAEFGLDVLWNDVFRNLFWTYVSTYGLNREAQETFLQLIIDQALQVWPKAPFWNKSAEIFAATLPDSKPAEQTGNVKPAEAAKTGKTPTRTTYFVNANDRKRISQALAAVSVESSSAGSFLAGIENEPVRLFWSDVIAALAGTQPEDRGPLFEEQRYVKISSFLDSHPFKRLLKNREQWIFTMPDKRLRAFAGNMLVLTPHRAEELFEKGQEAKLLPDAAPLQGLEKFRLAVALMAGSDKTARALWDAAQPAFLPRALRLAGMIRFNLPLPSVTSVADTDTQSNRLLDSLASAGGNAPTFPYEAPFWVRVEAGKINTTMLATWPLDRELVFAGWREQWLANPTSDLARRVAFLFPEQQFGMKCALYLAQNAVQDKQLGLASYYLGTVSPEDANADLQAKRLEVKAELEVARDLMPDAYATYQQLLASGAPISDVTRLKIAFLMQQMGNLKGGQENLRRLWAKRDKLSTAMQAEILFYLGEGEAALGDKDQALDDYLKLAWQYPQESMWALTAMYRASNIYEEREQYEPAVRLLQTVIKNAETPKQREAATARLESIQGKMGKPSEAGPGALPYPF